MPKFYLTTAIDYSNGDPHLGHALEKVGADCLARWRRLRGDDVHFLMGMDEHSQSVVQVAAKTGVTPQAWVDRMADTFAGYWRRLNCSHDDWIRTTEPRHGRAVTTLLERIQARHPEDLFEAEYEGLYCTGCEEFKQESQIVNGHCIEHPTLPLVPTREKNHFFRLSAYRDRVLALVTSGRLLVEPEIRRNEVVRLLEGGLQDISISRQREGWGIPYPGDPTQTVYVWFDALINYLSATGFPDAGYDRLWPADVHVIGKGITRFHCVIWPAMLLAADVALPRRVWAHGYVQWGGAKMSKTAGTAVSLDGAITRYGTDALRYFLLREIGFEGDGNFSWERFDARYTADLADTLGNLVSRTVSMIHRYRNGVVPASDSRLWPRATDLVAAYQNVMDQVLLHRGAEELVNLAVFANRSIEETAPWKLAKTDDHARLDAVLASLATIVAQLGWMAYPFMPAIGASIWNVLCPGVPLVHDRLAAGIAGLGGRTVGRPVILFPKPQSVSD